MDGKSHKWAKTVIRLQVVLYYPTPFSDTPQIQFQVYLRWKPKYSVFTWKLHWGPILSKLWMTFPVEHVYIDLHVHQVTLTSPFSGVTQGYTLFPPTRLEILSKSDERMSHFVWLVLLSICWDPESMMSTRSKRESVSACTVVKDVILPSQQNIKGWLIMSFLW